MKSTDWTFLVELKSWHSQTFYGALRYPFICRSAAFHKLDFHHFEYNFLSTPALAAHWWSS